VSPRLPSAPDLCGPQAPVAADCPDGIPVPCDAPALPGAAFACAPVRLTASPSSPAAPAAAAPS